MLCSLNILSELLLWLLGFRSLYYKSMHNMLPWQHWLVFSWDGRSCSNRMSKWGQEPCAETAWRGRREREREREREEWIFNVCMNGKKLLETFRCTVYSYTYMNICFQSPSNRIFYRQITGHWMSVADHRVAWWWKEVVGKQINNNWGWVHSMYLILPQCNITTTIIYMQ